MSRFEIDYGASVQYADDARSRPVWVVLERREPVHVAFNELDAKRWIEARRAEIVKDCDHSSMKAEIEGSVLTAECLDCETVFEADLRDTPLTEIGRQP